MSIFGIGSMGKILIYVLVIGGILGGGTVFYLRYKSLEKEVVSLKAENKICSESLDKTLEAYNKSVKERKEEMDKMAKREKKNLDRCNELLRISEIGERKEFGDEIINPSGDPVYDELNKMFP